MLGRSPMLPGLANGLMRPNMGAPAGLGSAATGMGMSAPGMPMRHLATGGGPNSNGGPLRLPQEPWGGADASNGPSMAYGGFAHGGPSIPGGGLSDPAALLTRGQLEQVMQGTPGSTAAGLVNSLVPGRTDQLPIDLQSGAYVLPADVVAAMGQGNTLAGGQILDQIFTQPPGAQNLRSLGLASGGTAREPVKTIIAGGEYLLKPRQVYNIGLHELGPKAARGAKYDAIMAAGHKALDRMVLKVRAQSIKHQKNLPGPKK